MWHPPVPERVSSIRPPATSEAILDMGYGPCSDSVSNFAALSIGCA